MILHTLGRSERLKGEKSIGLLFETGHSLSAYPIRIMYQIHPSPENVPVKIGFAVPKKKFAKAVDRNLLKRRMREAYRLNKYILVKDTENNVPFLEIMWIYQGQKAEDFDKICNSIKELLNKLSYKIHK